MVLKSLYDVYSSNSWFKNVLVMLYNIFLAVVQYANKRKREVLPQNEDANDDNFVWPSQEEIPRQLCILLWLTLYIISLILILVCYGFDSYCSWFGSQWLFYLQLCVLVWFIMYIISLTWI